MGKKVTTTEWIDRAKKVHEDKYDYSKTVYKTAKTKVIIICKQHGEFLQIPNSHDRGGGCPKCGYVRANKWTTNQFIEILRDRVGNTNYEVIGDYFGTTQKILTENKYGVCSTIANNLLKGAIPHIESAVDQTKYWINMAKEVHGDLYDYSEVKFIKVSKKVEIICKNHGSFDQAAYAHLSGSACPKCSNEILRDHPMGWSMSSWQSAAEISKNFESYKVYVLKCWDENEEFYKIGRTYTTVERRFRGKKMPYNYTIMKVLSNCTVEEAFNLENTLKREHRRYNYIPEKTFNGKFECFSKIDEKMWEKVVKDRK